MFYKRRDQQRVALHQTEQGVIPRPNSRGLLRESSSLAGTAEISVTRRDEEVNGLHILDAHPGYWGSGTGVVLAAAVSCAHCLRQCLSELADATHDYVANGFYAPTERAIIADGPDPERP